MGNEIMTRYLKSLKYVRNAVSEEERRKFQALVRYFQKYGEKYDVDWVLMGAQGYQESQLNQNVKSPAGAIGVMQLMPATGKAMKVGDITETEANIHAGIKYMRFMMNQYNENEPMTRFDKALFAFASYNAGAGRIATLRKVAAKRGLDPNVWFQNVEYVAAEKIGPETVTYVSNIYKYYIAYRLRLLTDIRIRAGEGIAGWVFREGVPLVMEDIEKNEWGFPKRHKYRTGSFISIPLKLDEKTIGVLNISDKISGEVFSAEDMALISSFAAYATIALERSTYYILAGHLKELSVTDSLTGLFNRRYFEERFFEELNRSDRHNLSFSLAMIDIDDFKLFNDSEVHLAGDEILKFIANISKDCLRIRDVIARFGGEEFAVIMPQTEKEEAIEVVAQRIEQRGIHAWFDLEPAELLGAEAEHYEKARDTLDVWFDSGVTHACVLEQRAELTAPCDMYLEGSDQHRGWFQSSLLTSVAMYDRAPYREVLTHGYTVDAEGRKMSKSLGNVVAPQDVMKTLGADIIRLWVAATNYRAEMGVSDEILKRTADAYRRIRNTARLCPFFLLAQRARKIDRTTITRAVLVPCAQ